ncbi:hypothetical protein KAFR_0C05080 [Kazachstania africana CBS 2517]|uniref:GDS1 winged helix domain-containing protein n=1 Tax=Kazachstania africana (strain ATCC 22294 / BCRC 22015 / CBS 2517 / CECT 1963 / NBRC 1671 / NRRL Y-8276) TaxID=1071382 RepID=H2ASZ9_KAZAF|nr:hypothetical protein KAFR_0C05080 [Kazachstania africana CBS 2517]CCF57499.1 hypothetical protein KAFR_0C05080 [Kazachstania africana CBS 2517]
MALTNSRPLQIPTMENDMLHNNSSPIFAFNTLNVSNGNNNMSFPGSETVNLPDINPSVNPNSDLLFDANGNDVSDNSMSRTNSNISAKPSRNNIGNSNSTPKKENPLLEISKLIPVTGERPMPNDKKLVLDDDVLYNVFIILWEQDPHQQGMTVKQLCDHLLVNHPEMSNLSTKLSNLVSAKLNAYVKKIEKGEKTLIYAISREWSNSSPRRMLYIYRGILAPDYKAQAQKVANELKQQFQTANNNASNDLSTFFDTLTKTPINKNNQNLNGKNQVIPSNLAFSLSPEFNIPYSSSPVSVTLNTASSQANSSMKPNNDDLMKPPSAPITNMSKKRSFVNSEKSARSKSSTPLSKKVKSSDSSLTLSNMNNNNSSSSTSISQSSIVTSSNQEVAQTPSTYVTAVAAAPRLSKLLPRNNSFNKSSNNNGMSGSIASSIHNLILTQTPVSRSPTSKNEITNEDWSNIVRNGFLTTDIESPESISLDELDNIFD